MPQKIAQAKNKTDIFNELNQAYRGASTAPSASPRTWKETNFNFASPSDVSLRGLKPLAALEVELKLKPVGVNLFDVYLAGQSNAEARAVTNVGTIKEGQ